MNKVRIVGAVASANGITFFLDDGQELNLQKDSAKAKSILDQTVDALARHETVEIDLDTYSIERQIEKKTGGIVRFLKTSVSRLFGGATPTTELETILIGTLDREHMKEMQVNDDDEITVAVVQTPAGQVAIPNVQHLERQMEHAVTTENAIGLQRFLERVASVAKERGHSVQELLNFMKRGDLPIADDGSIVAYKVLTTMRAPEGKFVDCHSKQVVQQLGSHVSMPVDRVDASRRTQCSTGLHIARRGYLRHFSGDIITIVKVAPEDVVAVPFNEPDKMRAAAYHIVAVLPKGVHATLRSNQPMTGDNEAARMLADVIAGNHVGIVDRVVIGGPKGTETKTVETGVKAEPVKTLGKTATALDDKKDETKVSIREVKKKVEAAVADSKAKAPAKAKPTTVVKQPKADKRFGVQPYVPLPTSTELKNGAAPVPLNDTKPAPKKSAAKTAKAVVTTKQSVKRGKAETVASIVELPANHVQALKLRKDGLSNREIERQLHICRKTLKKLFDANPKV